MEAAIKTELRRAGFSTSAARPEAECGWSLLIGLCLCLGLSMFALAQSVPDKPLPGDKPLISPIERLYNLQTVEIVKGEVVNVGKISGGRGESSVELTLRCSHEQMAVELCPAWYLESIGLVVQRGDSLEICGSRTTYHGSTLLIAADVSCNSRAFSLRDHSGVPLWMHHQR